MAFADDLLRRAVSGALVELHDNACAEAARGFRQYGRAAPLLYAKLVGQFPEALTNTFADTFPSAGADELSDVATALERSATSHMDELAPRRK